MRSLYLSGISPRFQGLSQSSWAGCLRITHPFASISVQQAGLLSIDLHVLGTPPAFILSQDQTLHLICSYIVTASRCLSYINLLTFVVSCNVSCFLFSFQRTSSLPFRTVLDEYIIFPLLMSTSFFQFFYLNYVDWCVSPNLGCAMNLTLFFVFVKSLFCFCRRFCLLFLFFIHFQIHSIVMIDTFL